VRVESLPSSNTLGRYVLVREIARSNDIVYEAVDPAIGRRVALKELQVPPNLVGAQRRERVERFYREAKAAGSLSHANIVTIHEVGEDAGRHFIAMEYLEGQSLREVLQVQGALPLPEILRIVTAVAEALEYAHDHGVVHRDVKPDNVYLLNDGRIKLTDFGIARLMFESNLTADGQVFGTPSYMSPEQVAGKAIDPRSDIFSLGVMLYEMLAGRKPFPGDSVVTITYNIMHQEPAPLTGVSPAIQYVLRRALAKDPEQRYGSAGLMARELQAALLAPVDRTGGPGRPGPTPPGAVPTGGGPSAAGTVAPSPNGGPPGAPRPNSPTGLFMNALAGLSADDLMPSRRRGARFRLSPEMRTLLGVLLAAVVVGLGLFFLVWSTMEAYHEWKRQQRQENAARYAGQAMQDYKTGQYERAIAGFEAAVRVDPDSEVGRSARVNGARAAAMYASILNKNGNKAGAIRWYQKAIEINPAYAGGYHLLAVLVAERGDEQQAEALWRQAIQIAESQMRMGRLPPEARADAQETLDHAQLGWGYMLVRRGMRHLGERRLPEARRAFEDAIRVAPGTDADRIAQEWLSRLPALP
jgi:type II secretory pathway pseudopilin PulG